MRKILHSDCNCFYAAVECLYHPEVRSKPVAVGGDAENRHGIILTKNYIAKGFGVKTGQTIWQARQLCPELVVFPPNFPLYKRYSNLVREIYLDYTSRVEPFGLDEAWLDVTGNVSEDSSGLSVAREISDRVKLELGITVSIGVSYNKIFAKLGSDYKKPDAITEILKDSYREIVWPLPAADLLYVGRATEKKLHTMGIYTIGDIANTPVSVLRSRLGKWGNMLYSFANGYDTSPVKEFDELTDVKSIGNSTTTPKDLTCAQDVEIVMSVLCDSVARRMRSCGVKGKTVSISVRDNSLFSLTRQKKLDEYTNITAKITSEAVSLFNKTYNWHHNIRSVGVSMSDLVGDDCPVQEDFFGVSAQNNRLEKLDTAVDGLKERFGTFSVCPAVMLVDRELSGFDPINDHTIHPVGYF